MKEATFEITVSCADIPEKVGRVAVADIVEEFSHRPQHRKVTCKWENGNLVLRAENDFDSDGQALAHEFSDAVCACVPVDFKVSVNVVSVVRR